MIWFDHSKDIPKGKHALLGASNYSWTNIKAESDAEFESLIRTRYYNSFATDVGTIIHEWACERINFKEKVVKSDSRGLRIYLIKNYIPRQVANFYISRCYGTVMNYINDSISFGLDAEVKLKYAEDSYGTTDAIIYKHSEFLRIHDLKTGTTPASLRQLEVYACFCCLEYNINPEDIFIELRIYQNDDVLIGNPTGEDLRPLMKHIIKANTVLEKIKRED